MMMGRVLVVVIFWWVGRASCVFSGVFVSCCWCGACPAAIEDFLGLVGCLGWRRAVFEFQDRGCLLVVVAATVIFLLIF